MSNDGLASNAFTRCPLAVAWGGGTGRAADSYQTSRLQFPLAIGTNSTAGRPGPHVLCPLVPGLVGPIDGALDGSSTQRPGPSIRWTIENWRIRERGMLGKGKSRDCRPHGNEGISPRPPFLLYRGPQSSFPPRAPREIGASCPPSSCLLSSKLLSFVALLCSVWVADATSLHDRQSAPGSVPGLFSPNAPTVPVSLTGDSDFDFLLSLGLDLAAGGGAGVAGYP
jgi:hypothetical protein